MQIIVRKRTILASQIFIACLATYLIRACFSITLAAMVESRDGANTKQNYGPRYDWTYDQQEYMLGGYYMGYIFGSFYSGYVGENHDTIKVLSNSVGAQGVLCALLPFTCKVHWSWVVVNQIACGYFGSFVYPSCHTLISRWAPPDERGIITSSLICGSIGTFILWYTFGTLVPEVGWTICCYILGGLVLTWAVGLRFLCAASPAEHSTIPSEEKTHIEKSLKGLKPHTGKLVVPPYKMISENKAFYSWTLLHFGNLWGLYFMCNLAPKFLIEGLGYDMSQAAILAGVPNFCRCFFGVVFAIIGDYIRKKKIWDVSYTRKVFVLPSHIAPGLLLILMSYCENDTSFCPLGLLVLALGFTGASIVTNLQVHQDLAPNYAGSIYGYANGLAMTFTALATSATGLLFKGMRNTPKNWKHVFFVGALSYWITGIQFLFFGSSTVQKFNDHVKGDEPERTKAGKEGDKKPPAGKPAPAPAKPSEASKPADKPPAATPKPSEPAAPKTSDPAGPKPSQPAAPKPSEAPPPAEGKPAEVKPSEAGKPAEAKPSEVGKPTAIVKPSEAGKPAAKPSEGAPGLQPGQKPGQPPTPKPSAPGQPGGGAPKPVQSATPKPSVPGPPAGGPQKPAGATTPKPLGTAPPPAKPSAPGPPSAKPSAAAPPKK